MLAEFGRQPLLVQWLALVGRFWQRVQQMEPGRLLREAVTANIDLYLRHREARCWVADFLGCLVHCGVLRAEQVQACSTAQQVWGLPVDEGGIRTRAGALFAGIWAEAAVDPRTAASDAVVASTYVRWVRGGPPTGPAPHFTALLGHKAKAVLLRLRVGSFPLRIATGRNEGSGVRNAAPGERLGPRGIAREYRTCQVCGQGTVEDLQHFLLECPAYEDVKQQFVPVFAPPHTTVAAILCHQPQARLSAAICSMLDQRKRLLSN